MRRLKILFRILHFSRDIYVSDISYSDLVAGRATHSDQSTTYYNDNDTSDPATRLGTEGPPEARKDPTDVTSGGTDSGADKRVL